MLILAILAFGMIVGWLAQLVLGMGTRPNAQSLIAGSVTMPSAVVPGVIDSRPQTRPPKKTCVSTSCSPRTVMYSALRCRSPLRSSYS